MLDCPVFLGNANKNRFLLVDLRLQEEICSDGLGYLSSIVCQTPFFDDVIVLTSSENAYARMQIFGGDGREADFCGNGALFSFSILFNEIQNKSSICKTLNLQTGDGVKSAVHFSNDRFWLKLGGIKSNDQLLTPKIKSTLKKLSIPFCGFRVSGEPHLVLMAPTYLKNNFFEKKKFEEIGEYLCDIFPYEGGTNITMIFSEEKNKIFIRTYERGARRMTLSCGSGALAVASILNKDSQFSDIQEISSPGGMHLVKYNQNEDDWWITGDITKFGQGKLGDILDISHESLNQKHHEYSIHNHDKVAGIEC